MDPRLQRFERLLLGAACLLVVAGLVCYLALTYQAYLNSDSASIVLFAELVWRSGQWSPLDWAYVSDALVVSGPWQLAAPAVAWLGPSHAAWAIAAGLSTLALVLATHALARQLGVSRPLAAAGGLLAASGISLLYSELVIGQMVGWWMATIALLFLALLRALDDGRWRWPLLAALIVLLQAASSPVRLLFLPLGPLLIGLAAWLLWQWQHGTLPDRLFVRRLGRLLGLLAVAAVLGWLWNRGLKSERSMNAAYARFDLVGSPQALLQHVLEIAAMGLRFLDAAPPFRALPPLLELANAVFRLGVALLVALTIPWLALRAFRRDDRPRALLGAYCLAGGTSTLLLLAWSAELRHHYGIYYFVAVGIVAVPLLLSLLQELAPRLRFLGVCGLLVPSLLLGLKNHVLAWPPYPNDYIGPGINQRASAEEQRLLLDLIRAQGQVQAVAPFWEANALTVLSGGSVRVVPALGVPPRAFPWLVDLRLQERILGAAPLLAIGYLDDPPVSPERARACGVERELDFRIWRLRFYPQGVRCGSAAAGPAAER